MKEHNENFYSLEELKRARDCYEGYQDGEEVFYFVGALRYACDEIERLNKEIKGYEQERERVLSIIDERNHKAIEHIDKELYNINVQENIMLKNELLKIKSMLQGVDKK